MRKRLSVALLATFVITVVCAPLLGQEPANGLPRVEQYLKKARETKDLGLAFEQARLAHIEIRKLPDSADWLHEHAQLVQALMVDSAGRLLANANEMAKNAGVEVADKWLAQAVSDLAEKMRVSGVKQEVSTLALLILTKFQQEKDRSSGLGKSLDRLERVIDHEHVAPLIRMYYWNQRGLFETKLRRFAAARQASERCRNLAIKLGDVGLMLIQDNNLGHLALARGDYPQAERFLEPTVKTLEQKLDKLSQLREHYVRAANNLAKVLEWRNEGHMAERQIRNALKSAEFPELRSLCLTNLGMNLYLRGQYKEAEVNWDLFLKEAIQTFGPTSQRAAEANANLGWAALANRELQAAECRFRLAIEVMHKHHDRSNPRLAEFFSYHARALYMLGEEVEARRLLRQAITLREDFLEQTLRTALSERDRLAFVQEQRVHFESPAWPGVLDTFLELGPLLGIPTTEQHQHVLTWKGIIRRHRFPRAEELENDDELRAVVAERERVLNDLRGEYFFDARKEEMGRLEEIVDRLEQKLREMSPRFAEIEGTTVNARDICSLLDDESALLDIVEFRRFAERGAEELVRESNAYAAYLYLPGEDRPVRIELGPTRDIDRLIRRLLSGLETDDYEEPARELHQLVVAKVAPYLSGVKSLVTVGDGAFHRLPLALLPGTHCDRDFWAGELAFSTAPTVQSFVQRLQRPRGNGETTATMLAIGGLDFGPDWEALTGTSTEVEAISGLFHRRFPRGKISLLDGAGGTKEQVIERMKGSQYLHFATHGSFRDRRSARSFGIPGLVAQLDSSLVLSRPERPNRLDAQYLTAEEIGRLRLEDVRLAVLSACNTGLGYPIAGQSTIGLFGAFDQAGAQSILGSLWKVDDAATTTLMKEFYHQLWKMNLSPSAALQAAQLKMIRANNGKHRHPRYWAAFVLAGAP